MLAFVLVFLAFNVTMLWVTLKAQTDKAVVSRFETLDQLYKGKEQKNYNPQQLLENQYIIVNDEGDISYSSNSMNSLSRKVDTEDLLDYFMEHDDWDDDNDDSQFSQKQLAQVTIKKKIYYVKMTDYYGELKDYYVKSSDSDDSQPYFAFVFVNVTPLYQFLIIVNVTRGGLMIAVLLLTWFLFYRPSRKISQSFSRLSAYVTSVGNREETQAPTDLAYDEFNQVSQMSQMIESSRHSQELFFQNSYHELRTPHMSIQGYAEAIQAGVMDSQEASKVILSESTRMLTLVDEILTLSKRKPARPNCRASRFL